MTLAAHLARLLAMRPYRVALYHAWRGSLVAERGVCGHVVSRRGGPPSGELMRVAPKPLLEHIVHRPALARQPLQLKHRKRRRDLVDRRAGGARQIVDVL